MTSLRPALVCAVLLVWPALAASGGAHDGRCLAPRDVRTRIQAENLVRPGSIRSLVEGDIVALELCEAGDRLAYVATVLRPDGAVERVWFDARSGRRMRP